MKKVVILVAALLWIFCPEISGQTPIVQTKIHATEYTVTAADGLKLYAWLTPSPHGEGQLWVLLPMMGNTHTSYNKFIKALYARFKTPDSTRTLQKLPHILALDLRGHGESTKGKDGPISHASMEPEDFVHYPADVAAVIKKVLADKSLNIDRSNIVIIGASIGANTSVMTANMIEGVSKVVMLSPGRDYRSLQPGADLDKFKGKPLLLAASDDKYSADSVDDFAVVGKERFTTKIFGGPYHGTDLIDNDPQAMAFVLNWLVK